MALPIDIEDLLNKRKIENNIIRRVGGDKGVLGMGIAHGTAGIKYGLVRISRF